MENKLAQSSLEVKYGFKELMADQQKDLDYKINTAKGIIEASFALSKHKTALAFSGGKDSTVLWHLIRECCPDESKDMQILFCNTGVEFPESLSFARQLGKDWGGDNFHETKLSRTEKEGYKYAAQQEILQYLIDSGKVQEVLTHEGKLKSIDTLEKRCPDFLREKFIEQNLIYPAGTVKSFWWCLDQYGYPLLGKDYSKLKARRINIDCFLKFSESKSEKEDLLDYYETLKTVKISQACCDVLKKEPSEKLQAELDVDVIFKGLMAAESRKRALSFLEHGYIYKSHRKHLNGDGFYHCNPLGIWTDEDIWEYIKRFNVPYAPLYDMQYESIDGDYCNIKRNGCFGCCTDMQFKDNHIATLRQTHLNLWWMLMNHKGYAKQLTALRKSRHNGQLMMTDYMPLEQALEIHPCMFDSID